MIGGIGGHCEYWCGVAKDWWSIVVSIGMGWWLGVLAGLGGSRVSVGIGCVLVWGIKTFLTKSNSRNVSLKRACLVCL